jgi:hypothetical protein
VDIWITGDFIVLAIESLARSTLVLKMVTVMDFRESTYTVSDSFRCGSAG